VSVVSEDTNPRLVALGPNGNVTAAHAASGSPFDALENLLDNALAGEFAAYSVQGLGQILRHKTHWH
ncbi:MAG TPA: hypothetical protein DC060_16075, partial [Gemmatimonadetes bacterium]|nr:hypothetical protein [Gemmatimonadota bacterium]